MCGYCANTTGGPQTNGAQTTAQQTTAPQTTAQQTTAQPTTSLQAFTTTTTSFAGTTNSISFSPGDKVVRGPTWHYGNQVCIPVVAVQYINTFILLWCSVYFREFAISPFDKVEFLHCYILMENILLLNCFTIHIVIATLLHNCYIHVVQCIFLEFCINFA